MGSIYTGGVLPWNDSKRAEAESTLRALIESFEPDEISPVCDEMYLVRKYNAAIGPLPDGSPDEENWINGDTVVDILGGPGPYEVIP